MIVKTLVLGPLGANCYIVINKNKAVVIDPGFWGDELYLNIKDLDVEYILLTHGHLDHISAAGRLKECTHANVAIHRDDAGALLNNEENLSKMMNSLYSKESGCVADILLSDGDELTFADTVIKVIHTKGHTQGGVCFMIDDMLFTGDTLFAGNVGRTDLKGGNTRELMQSLEVIKKLDVTKIFPGHGEATTLDRERKENAYMRSKYEIFNY